MSRKDKKKSTSGSSDSISRLSPSIISKRGWKTILIGIAVVVLGYITLAFTDPRGQNLASQICPFLIIGGYATIGVGILLKDPVDPSLS